MMSSEVMIKQYCGLSLSLLQIDNNYFQFQNIIYGHLPWQEIEQPFENLFLQS